MKSKHTHPHTELIEKKTIVPHHSYTVTTNLVFFNFLFLIDVRRLR